MSRIIGVGQTSLGKLNQTASSLMKSSLFLALSDAGINLKKLDGLIAVPSLSNPRFMEAHSLATQIGLLPSHRVVVRTIDTGGAGPISGLLMADRMIRIEECSAVAVVAGDAVGSLANDEFLRRADTCCSDPKVSLKSPVIPNGYNRIAEWHLRKGNLTREQLAMVSVLMSRQAVRHPLAMTKKPYSLNQVLNSKEVASVTSLLECARKTDGGGAIILASDEFIRKNSLTNKLRSPVVVGGGEGSGPLYLPSIINEQMFSCGEATRRAYATAQISVKDIDFFGLYDCFPICFIRAVEAVGLAPVGGGGKWVEDKYNESEINGGVLSPDKFPVNTHGGLLGFGAPWETPALYNVIEAVNQMNRTCGVRQIKKEVNNSLVYGNGGIFSSSAVAILSKNEPKNEYGHLNYQYAVKEDVPDSLPSVSSL